MTVSAPGSATSRYAPPGCTSPAPVATRRADPRRHASAFPADSARVPARPAEFVGTRSYGRNVNRTDRLYALVEELRACAPRRRSARELASLYEVSARTIERDIGALQQAGVPIYADAGQYGVTPWTSR